jgi:hypothetical protein
MHMACHITMITDFLTSPSSFDLHITMSSRQHEQFSRTEQVGQVILLLTISQSARPSWTRAPQCDSWPNFCLEEKFRYCLSWSVHPDGWSGLPCTRVTYTLYLCSMFVLMCGCLSRFHIIIIIIIYLAYYFQRCFTNITKSESSNVRLWC